MLLVGRMNTPLACEKGEKYDPKAKLRDKRYKAKRTVHSHKADEGIAKSDPSTITWKPNKDEQKMPDSARNQKTRKPKVIENGKRTERNNCEHGNCV